MQVAMNNKLIPVVKYGNKEIMVYGEYDFYILNVNGVTIYATHSIPSSDTDLYYSLSLRDAVLFILRHYADEKDILNKYNIHVNDLIKCVQNNECDVGLR